MQDKRDTETNQCVKNFSKKPRLKNGRPIKNASGAFASDEEETMVTAPSDQAQASESDSSEDHLSDSHDGFAAKYKIVQVKEESASSEEEGMANSEAVLFEECPTTQCERSSDAFKCNISRSKEIPEDIRRRIIEAHENGKGYKKISKDLDLPLSTVRHIVCKWKKFSTVATLPRSGRPTKIGARARRTILRHMTENPMVKAKDLQASLALDNINVHESTIRRTLNKWCSWDFTTEEITALQKE